MIPEERRLIDDLFDRLASLENSPRDSEAERAIAEGLARAPNAVYALVQTALVQDEALRRASVRIEELEGRAQAQQVSSASFLDPMRDAVSGQGQSHGSVPSVKPADTTAPRGPIWNSGQVLNSGYPDPRNTGFTNAPGYPAASVGSGSGSFLGTAAAAAAGMIGGSLLMNGIRGLSGGNHQAFGDSDALASRNPWSSDQSNSDLARDAGLNDIGKGESGHEQHQGLFDNASNDEPNGGDYGDGDGFDSNGSDDA
jgi:uncharacterized protein